MTIEERKGETARRGDWYQTFTGREVYPLDMRPEDVDIQDIAHSLAHICRFNGACRVFWSVAEHSLQVSEYLNELRLAARAVLDQANTQVLAWGLMHDASEAYIGDIVRPVKRSLVGVSEIEEHIQKVIAERFGLPWPIPEVVKLADEVLLATEARDFMASPPRPWGLRAKPWSRDLRVRIDTQQAVRLKFKRAAMNLGIVTKEEAGL